MQILTWRNNRAYIGATHTNELPSPFHPNLKGTGLKHGMDQETDRKTDRDKLQIQKLERNLD